MVQKCFPAPAETGSSPQGSLDQRQQARDRAAASGPAVYTAPLCRGHQEPCVKKRVNKSGPNKGELAR